MVENLQIEIDVRSVALAEAIVARFDARLDGVGRQAGAAAQGFDRLDRAAVGQARSLDALAGAATALTPAFGRAGAAVDSLSHGLGRLDAARVAAGAGIAALGGAVLGGLAQMGGAATTFEHQMAQVRAVMAPEQWAESGQALNRLALQLGRGGLGFSATEAAQGLEQMAKAGIAVEDMSTSATDVLRLAAAGTISVGEAAEFAANTMSVFGLQGRDMARIANLMAGAANATTADIGDLRLAMQQFGGVAQLTGQSVESAATAIAVMAQNGVRGSDAGTSLKTMFLNLQPATKQAAEEMQRLGLITAEGTNRFINANGTYKQAGEIAAILAEQTRDLTQAQRAASLEIIFSSDAVRAATFLARAGAEGWAALTAEIGKVTAAEVASARLDSLHGSLQKLGASVNAAAIDIGGRLAPGLQGLVDRATLAVDAVGDLPPALQASVGQVGLLLGGVTALTGGLVALGAVAPALTAGLAVLGTTVGAVALPVTALVVASAALVVAWNHDWGGIQGRTAAAATAITDELGRIQAQAAGVADFMAREFAPRFQEGLDGALASLGRTGGAAQLWTRVMGLDRVGESVGAAMAPVGPALVEGVKLSLLGMATGGVGPALLTALGLSEQAIRGHYASLTAVGGAIGDAVATGVEEELRGAGAGDATTLFVQNLGRELVASVNLLKESLGVGDAVTAAVDDVAEEIYARFGEIDGMRITEALVQTLRVAFGQARVTWEVSAADAAAGVEAGLEAGLGRAVATVESAAAILRGEFKDLGGALAAAGTDGGLVAELLKQENAAKGLQAVLSTLNAAQEAYLVTQANAAGATTQQARALEMLKAATDAGYLTQQQYTTLLETGRLAHDGAAGAVRAHTAAVAELSAAERGAAASAQVLAQAEQRVLATLTASLTTVQQQTVAAIQATVGVGPALAEAARAANVGWDVVVGSVQGLPSSLKELQEQLRRTERAWEGTGAAAQGAARAMVGAVSSATSQTSYLGRFAATAESAARYAAAQAGPPVAPYVSFGQPHQPVPYGINPGPQFIGQGSWVQATPPELGWPRPGPSPTELAAAGASSGILRDIRFGGGADYGAVVGAGVSQNPVGPAGFVPLADGRWRDLSNGQVFTPDPGFGTVAPRPGQPPASRPLNLFGEEVRTLAEVLEDQYNRGGATLQDTARAVEQTTGAIESLHTGARLVLSGSFEAGTGLTRTAQTVTQIAQVINGAAGITDQMAGTMRDAFARELQEMSRGWETAAATAAQLRVQVQSHVDALNTYSGHLQAATSSLTTRSGGAAPALANPNLGAARNPVDDVYAAAFGDAEVVRQRALVEALGAAGGSGTAEYNAALTDYLNAQQRAVLAGLNPLRRATGAGELAYTPYAGGGGVTVVNIQVPLQTVFGAPSSGEQQRVLEAVARPLADTLHRLGAL